MMRIVVTNPNAPGQILFRKVRFYVTEFAYAVFGVFVLWAFVSIMALAFGK